MDRGGICRAWTEVALAGRGWRHQLGVRCRQNQKLGLFSFSTTKETSGSYVGVGGGGGAATAAMLANVGLVTPCRVFAFGEENQMKPQHYST